MGGMSGSGGSTTTVQKSEPWEQQKPYLIRGFEQAERRVLDKTPSFFPESTVVPFSPESALALQGVTQRALAGSPLTQMAQGQLRNTLSDEYLQGGKAFQQSVDAAVRQTEKHVLPQIQSTFNRAGRFGSGLAQEAVATAIADTVGGQYAKNYAGERENQMRGLLLSPQLANQDYADLSKLAEVGSAHEQMAQEQLNEQMARHRYDQTIEQQQLSDYMNLIQGNYGMSGSSTATQASNRNPILSGLGGGLLGYGMQSYLPSAIAPFAPVAGLLSAFF